ncbi:hypothetical protein ERJ75_000141800 [Trypanosoma vivax]|nr:hypothetical protein TRVL_00194 [Trypanosoma vivax]KAH8619739.1 hypothetical protein ERJ75_000141800 [Trypanosoma vivax]
MDVAAFRRLQHRMESRGRAARSCSIQAGNSTPHCTCLPPSAVMATDCDSRCGSAPTLSPAAQAWLIWRLENVEVDITDGGVNHGKIVPCCCRCCQGYHHMHHVPKRCVEEETVLGKSHKTDLVPAAAAAPATDTPAPAIDTDATAAPEGKVENCTLPPSPSEVKELHSLDEMKVSRPEVSNVFMPSKSSLLLASVLRNAEAAASSAPKRPAMYDASGVVNYNISEAVHHVPEITTSSGAVGNISQSMFIQQPLLETRNISCNTLSAATGGRMRTEQEQEVSLSEVHQELEQQYAPQSSEKSTDRHSFSAVGLGRARLLEHKAVETAFDGQCQVARAVGSTPDYGTVRSVQSPPLVASTGTQTLPYLSVASQAGEDLCTPIPPPLLQQSRREGVTQTTSEISPTGVVTPAVAGGGSFPAQQRQPIAHNGTSSSAAVEASRIIEKGAAVQPVTDESTPNDFITAMREKLLLERNDAFGRAIEHQTHQGVQTQYVEEQHGMGARSRNQEEILILLARLHRENQEVLDALYDTVTEQEEESMMLPCSVLAGERPGSFLTAVVPPVSGAAAATPANAEVVSLSPLSAGTLSSSSQNARQFPAGVMAAYEVEPENAAVPPVQGQTPPPTGTAPAQTASAIDVSDETMKSWVDKHFSTTLDAQHRALLQHVLLSREAEMRRVEAVESQCKELEARLAAVKSAGVVQPPEVTASAMEPHVRESAANQPSNTDSCAITAEEVLKTQMCQQPVLVGVPEGVKPTQDLVATSNALNAVSANDKSEEAQRKQGPHIESGETFKGDNVSYFPYVPHLALHDPTSSTTAANEPINTSVQPRSAPMAAKMETVQLSSIASSQPTYNTQTATPKTSTTSLPQPLLGVQDVWPTASCTAQHLTPGALPQQRCMVAHTGIVEAPPASISNVPSVATVTPVVGTEREMALKQLREEMERECVRFAAETKRWHEFIENQGTRLGRFQ